MSTAQSIEENRKHYCTRLTLVRWMLQFCNILQGIDPQTLWNMDETHLAKTIENDLHVISRGDHKQQLEELEANKETVLKSHVSVVCTCNAAGKSFMPMFIRQTQNGDSIPDYIEDVVRGHGLLAQNTSGYMTKNYSMNGVSISRTILMKHLELQMNVNLIIFSLIRIYQGEIKLLYNY